jgi:hypothetical protein
MGSEYGLEIRSFKRLCKRHGGTGIPQADIVVSPRGFGRLSDMTDDLWLTLLRPEGCRS